MAWRADSAPVATDAAMVMVTRDKLPRPGHRASTWRWTAARPDASTIAIPCARRPPASCRLETAKASARVGKIRHDLGKYEEATKAYQRATMALDELARQFPDHPEYRHELAGSQFEAG